ncbi:toll/interleukin-1 receptor domain-containing protein [Candidatus Thiothrix anitrata]|uniref:TIR domain-containing protein n=1 Tax=Candidatus Thiothrix anitrata TaxID=2823902 RepID=A0ABX7X0M9_9GAMM|nr:toll/interleukin-1 receptor domain-containing protein [Candidatus Thiothrix anitrata]QTR48957.1 TIR domain-containing protein [Candidatus Thiothrix anitrata]
MDSKIFISYRRLDSFNESHSLYLSLIESSSPNNIFLDIDNINPGVNFEAAIKKAISQIDAILIMIGPNWEGKKEDRENKIMEEGDYVRLEVREAIKMGTKIIPILVKRDNMPEESSLPDDISAMLKETPIKTHNKSNKEIIKEIRKKVETKKPKSISLNAKFARSIYRGWPAYGWMPLFLILAYLNKFGPVGIGLLFAIPALSGILSLRYGLHGLISNIIITIPIAFTGIKGEFGQIGGVGGYVISGWLLSYFLSSKDAFQDILKFLENKYLYLVPLISLSFFRLATSIPQDNGIELIVHIDPLPSAYIFFLFIGISGVNFKKIIIMLIMLGIIWLGLYSFIPSNISIYEGDELIRFANKYTSLISKLLGFLLFYYLGFQINSLLKGKYSKSIFMIIGCLILYALYDISTILPYLNENLSAIKSSLPIVSALSVSGILVGLYAGYYQQWEILIVFMFMLIGIFLTGISLVFASNAVITIPLIWLGFYFFGRELRVAINS